MIRVFKFGGASVKEADAIKNACNILKKHADNSSILLVVSAMGKMTNAFENLHKAWFKGENTEELLQKIIVFHNHVVSQLFEYEHVVCADIEAVFTEVKSVIARRISDNKLFDQTYDALIPYGEILSACILTHYAKLVGLNADLVNAFDYVFADDLWREGRIKWDITTEAIRKNILPQLMSSNNKILITQGFVARSSQGPFITLGREGSDFSASVFAYALDASEVTIWKDVAGLFNADPKAFDDVQLIPHLSYHEAVELAYYGQSIIHPKTIKPLQNKNIPLYIKSFIEPSLSGSIIDKDTGHDTDIPCFILKQNQMLVSISPKDFAFINEHNMGEIIGHLAQIRIRMNVMQNSAISFSFCADSSSFKLRELLEKLKVGYFVKYNTGLRLITIRNYNEEIITELSGKSKVYLEQRSRTTVQLVTS